MTVDVARQDGGKARGDEPAGDHIPSPPEDEAGRTDARTLDRMMDAKQTRVGREVPDAGLFEKAGEACGKGAAAVGKPGQGQAHPPHAKHEGARPIEDHQARQVPEKRIGHDRSFVIARHQGDRNRDRAEAIEGEFHQPAPHAAAVEKIPAVDDQIDTPRARGFQGAVEGPEEIGPPSAARGSGAQGEIEPQVGVGEEENANGGRDHTHSTSRFRRPASRRRVGLKTTSTARSAMTRRRSSVLRIRRRS